jgi:hypothetical protein
VVSRSLTLMLLIVPPALAQQPVVSPRPARFAVESVTPAQNALQVARTASVQITFTQAVDVGTLTSAGLEIFGKYGGVVNGALSASGDGRTITFQPARPFSAGDLVQVSLSKNVASALRQRLEKGFAWCFVAASRPGSLGYTLAGSLVPGATPYGALGGDLDDDGWLDLAIPNEDSSDVSVFLNLGGGAFGPKVSYGVGFHCSPSEAADLDGDGDVDLAVGNILADDVSVLIGRGDGTFEPQKRYATGRQPRGLATLDADGDADTDLVTANRMSAGSLSLLLNEGDGTFAPEVRLEASLSQETGIGACDLNGDGVTDLVVVGYASDQVAVLLGDGDAHFSVHSVGAIGAEPWMVTWGDLDGDGDLDVGAVLSSANQVALAFNDGHGTLGAPVTRQVGSFPISIDFGDLDGDGDLDVAASNFGSADYTFFRNDGTGSLGGKFTLPAINAGSCTVLHDRDGDGDVDITAIDELADLVFLFRQDG